MRKFFSAILLIFLCSFAWQLGHESQGNPVDVNLEKKSPCNRGDLLPNEANRKPSASRLNSNPSLKP